MLKINNCGSHIYFDSFYMFLKSLITSLSFCKVGVDLNKKIEGLNKEE